MRHLGYALFIAATGFVIGGMWVSESSQTLLITYQLAELLVLGGVVGHFLGNLDDRRAESLFLPCAPQFNCQLENQLGPYGRLPVRSWDEHPILDFTAVP